MKRIEVFTDAGRRRLRREGCTLAVEEIEMHRSLRRAVSPQPFPDGTRLMPWRIRPMHRVYRAAFRERPGFPDWSTAKWRSKFMRNPAPPTALVMAGMRPVAYLCCEIEGDAGWISQLGVHPSWRRRGLGAALTAHALQGFKDLGLRRAMLDVATNNLKAARLYRRLGFREARIRSVFVKST